MAEERDSATAAPKYSRYRSVRQQAHPARIDPAPPPPPIPEPEQNANFSRSKSMSRYRRPRSVPKNEAPEQPAPPLPSIATPSQTKNPAIRPETARNLPGRAAELTPSAQPVPEQSPPKETERERLRRKAQEYRAREEAARRLEEEEAQREVEEEAELARRKEKEAARILAEQKRKDLERLEAQLEAAAPTVTSPKEEKVVSPGKEKFSLFSRKRTGTQSAAQRNSQGANGARKESMSEKRSNEQPQAILEGGAGIVPQTDAPISASNAGERRVLIRCKQSSINLPVNPETTPKDIIFSAANIMTQDISPSTAVLCESYTLLGLERRIRRYEHVRDIMNSWDRDTQNALLLQNSDSPNNDYDLETAAVPKEAPPDITVYMYHSQRPGKWNKRFITLLSTGQMHVSKKPTAKASDKDINNICHLSDFDIYTSTPQYSRKTLKPPKKHCYAVKSQQKPTMFLSTENFVHYFSTDDNALASKWYTAIQRWRSWYLVNRMGEGVKKPKPVNTAKTAANHHIKLSVDENPYTIGSFTPLLNLDRFNNPPPPTSQSQPKKPSAADDEYDSEDENRPLQIPLHLRNGLQKPANRDSRRDRGPPIAYKAPAAETEGEFSSSGLLGRTYSQRQKAQRERDLTAQNPFTETPGNLLSRQDAVPTAAPSTSHGAGHKRTLSTKSTTPATARRPATSGEALGANVASGMPKPLLDFTPQFKEAPQWDKSRKGRGVKAPVAGGPLVDGATSGEAVEMVGKFMPEPAVFRRDQVAAAQAPGQGQGQRPRTSRGVGGSGSGREDGFVEGGLIAGAGRRA